jgi:glyoxylase-like metal-dependent hydrolase (beta-lactamase superfamily II)
MRSLTKLLPRFAFSLAKQVNLYKPLSVPLFNSILMKPQMNFSAHKNVIKSSYNGDGFYVEQMLTGCLAIYSYYIESNGEAIIIDPQNDISSYNEILAERKAKLKGVFMTHYHADYVAGHK